MKSLTIAISLLVLSGCSYMPTKSQQILADMNGYGCTFSSVEFEKSKDSSSISISCK